jgi:hypothetical protein
LDGCDRLSRGSGDGIGQWSRKRRATWRTGVGDLVVRSVLLEMDLER